MRLAVFVPNMTRPNGIGTNISAHVQIPLCAAGKLADAGFEVELLTTGTVAREPIPPMLSPCIPLHDASCLQQLPRPVRARMSALLLPLEVIKLRAAIRTRRYDLVHLFGSPRLVWLGGLLKCSGFCGQVGLTLLFPPAHGPRSDLSRLMWRRLDVITTATKFVSGQLARLDIPHELVRHGIVHSLPEAVRSASPTNARRVTYWRAATRRNGIDVAMEAFRRLAPKYPDLTFTFAVREHVPAFAGRLEQLDSRIPNIEYHEFPFVGDVTLPQLLRESILAVQPYRELSCQPQLSLLENVACGIPVVTTDVESNPGVVEDGYNGLLVPEGDVEATTRAIIRLIEDDRLRYKMQQASQQLMRDRWNWDGYGQSMLGAYGLRATD